MATPHHFRGVTLIELLIGLVISLIILGGAVYIFTRQVDTHLFQTRSTRFLQQVRDVVDRMSGDIRRAGYQGLNYHLAAPEVVVSNPFDYDPDLPPNPTLLDMDSVRTTVDVGALTGEPASSCITFSYNLDDDNPPRIGLETASPPVGVDNDLFDLGANEIFGFRRAVDADGIGAIWSRVSGTPDNDNCNNGDWAIMTDPRLIDVTTLEFVYRRYCTTLTQPDPGFAYRADCYATISPDPSGNGYTAVTTDDPIAGDLIMVSRSVGIVLEARSAEDELDVSSIHETAVDLPNMQIIQVQ